MLPNVTPLERAFQLARSGQYDKVQQIRNRRNVVVASAFYVVPLIYTIKTLQRYIDHTGGQYQESVLRKDMSFVPIARDLKLDLVSTVNFPSWGSGLPGLPKPVGASGMALAAAAATVFLVGAVLTAISGHEDRFPPRRALGLVLCDWLQHRRA